MLSYFCALNFLFLKEFLLIFLRTGSRLAATWEEAITKDTDAGMRTFLFAFTLSGRSCLQKLNV